MQFSSILPKGKEKRCLVVSGERAVTLPTAGFGSLAREALKQDKTWKQRATTGGTGV